VTWKIPPWLAAVSMVAAFALTASSGVAFAAQPLPTAGCDTSSTQSFDIGTGSHEVSGCPSEDLVLGTFEFPWHNYVTVSSSYSSVKYTKLQIDSGSGTSGADAWYGPVYVFQDVSNGEADHSDSFICDGVRYTDASISPDWSLGFSGSTKVTAEQYVYMNTSGTCGEQTEGTPTFTVYH